MRPCTDQEGFPGGDGAAAEELGDDPQKSAALLAAAIAVKLSDGLIIFPGAGHAAEGLTDYLKEPVAAGETLSDDPIEVVGD